MKKAWDIISTVLVWVVVAISVAMMIFTIVSVNTFNRGDRDIFGFKAFIVLSDSMSATDFDAGDLVLIREVDPTTLQVGDIITYQSQNSHNYGENVTHKIRTLTTAEDGMPGFVTYGTTTDTNDETIVTYPYIQGKYVLALPGVGTFFQFLRTPQGYILCILLPFLLLIGYQGLNCVKIFRMYKAEQMAEIQAEKDAIEAERKKSEEMMQQLLAMQAAMQQQTAPAAAPPAAAPQTEEAKPAEEAAPVEEIKSEEETPAEEAKPEAEAQQVDIAAMMAELAALRAQLAGNAAQEKAGEEPTEQTEA